MTEQRVLFVGAGEMIELCAAHFASTRPRYMCVANRTMEGSRKLADRFGCAVMRLNDLSEHLADYDIVVSCTASPLPLIGLGLVERVLKLRRHRPVVMIDLAVPRDIEPEVANLDDVFFIQHR